MPTMTFDQSLALIHTLADLWRQFHPPLLSTAPENHLRADEGQLHLYLWRSVVEGWSVNKCIDAFYVQHGKTPPPHP